MHKQTFEIRGVDAATGDEWVQLTEAEATYLGPLGIAERKAWLEAKQRRRNAAKRARKARRIGR